jgi:hypothetical protein
MNNGASSAFPALTAEARTKSPAANSSSSIEGWLQNSQPPPSSNAVPVLPAKPPSSELNDSWSSSTGAVAKPDPWGINKQPPQQVPDPWNSKTSSETLDPWAPVSGGGDILTSGVSFHKNILLFGKFVMKSIIYSSQHLHHAKQIVHLVV